MAKQPKIIRPYGETEIEEHAAKVGGKQNLREIFINTDDDVKYAYLVRKPSRSVMQALASAEERKDTNKGFKLLLGCVLEGDEDLIDNDGSVFLTLTEQISDLVSKSKVEIKKL